MIKEIVKDLFVLSQKSQDATADDFYILQDLKDTLEAHKDHCVGMAANMIGYLKNMIIFEDNGHYTCMVNPVILKTSAHMYSAMESCLSHEGSRETKRYDKIKVSFIDENGKKKIKSYQGFTAQIIQHEIDHCLGILI